MGQFQSTWARLGKDKTNNAAWREHVDIMSVLGIAIGHWGSYNSR